MWDYVMPIETPYSFTTIAISGEIAGVCDIENPQITADGVTIEVPG